MSELRARDALVDPSLKRTWGRGTSRNFMRQITLRAVWPAMAEAKGQGGLTGRGERAECQAKGMAALSSVFLGGTAKGTDEAPPFPPEKTGCD